MIPTRIVSRLAVVAVCSFALVSMMEPVLAKKKYSGFLPDYSKLKKEKDPLGRKRLIWISPKLTRANYQKMVIEKVSFYPAPQASKQVSGEVLYEIRDYLDATLRKAISAGVPLVDKAGPGVVRLRMAVTGVAVKKGLKPHQYLPIGLIRAGAKEAAGVRKHDVDLFVEAEMTDSVTGEILAMGVRKAKGVDVKGKAQLRLEDAKPQIDQWGEALQQMVIMRMK